jgi:hypothetical protein
MPKGIRHSGYKGGSATVTLTGAGTFYSPIIVVDSDCDVISCRLQYPAGVTDGTVSLQLSNVPDVDEATETDWTDAADAINDQLLGLDGVITSEMFSLYDGAFIYRLKFVVVTGSGDVLLNWSLK